METDTAKSFVSWHSPRMDREIALARWGTWGTPVLVLPTAGGDAEEVERNWLVAACGPLLAAGRVKLYSCDSVAGRVMMTAEGPVDFRLAMLNRFHDALRREVLPAIWADCGGQELPVIVAGASIGAFNAVALLCRYPDVVSHAVAMSGTYTVERLYGGYSDDLFYASPLHFLPGLDGAQLDTLRQRFAILASGEGAWENVGESWRMAHELGLKGVPNRVDPWGTSYGHDWETWRAMLPQYLDELTR